MGYMLKYSFSFYSTTAWAQPYWFHWDFAWVRTKDPGIWPQGTSILSTVALYTMRLRSSQGGSSWASSCGSFWNCREGSLNHPWCNVNQSFRANDLLTFNLVSLNSRSVARIDLDSLPRRSSVGFNLGYSDVKWSWCANPIFLPALAAPGAHPWPTSHIVLRTLSWLSAHL